MLDYDAGAIANGSLRWRGRSQAQWLFSKSFIFATVKALRQPHPKHHIMPSFYKIEVGPEHLNPHLKVYLKDISQNPKIKELLEDLPAVDHVNITERGKKSDLTLYPNKAYDIKEVRDDVAAFLDEYFEHHAAPALPPAPASVPSAPLVSTPAPAAIPASPPEHLTVFISYSWDGKPHQEWVLALADRLQSEGGVKVLLDQYDLRAGKNLTLFMEKSVTAADKVVMIMTPNYKLKADGRTGGVGYEYSLITAHMFTNQNSGKFIPVARAGKYDQCSPTFIASLVSHDMTDDKKFEEQFEELLRLIHDEPLVVAPPIGPKPVFATHTPATAPPRTAATGISPTNAAPAFQTIPSGPLIDDSANMAASRMPNFAHWTLNFKLASLSDLSLSSLFMQIHTHRIAKEGGRYYLPFVLNDTQKKGHYPNVDYEITLKGIYANQFEAEGIQISIGNIKYEYAEYSDHGVMLLRLVQPFTTLLYLLVILKAIHNTLNRKPSIELEILFSSNRKAMLYVNSQQNPFLVPRNYGLQNMIIPGNTSSRKKLLSEITKDSVFEVFQDLYTMFIAENPLSNLPYVELDKASFLSQLKEFFDPVSK
jgi:TIR domain